MPKPIPELLEYFLSDCLEGDSSYSTRAMMGGYSIYKHGKIFAVFSGDQIYFKTHAQNLEDFENAGSAKFAFRRKDGSVASMNYHVLPEEILENREALQDWIEKALDY